MPRVLRGLCYGFVASIVYSNAALADLENENLLVSMPAGYKVDFQQRKNNMLMTEMVPTNESVKNWTEMVTVQIFYGMKDVAPEQFRNRIEQLWQGSCAGSTSNSIAQGVERGYPAMMWVMFCPVNGGTGKPENTWFRAIRGADSFYVVQKAFKFTPSREQEYNCLAFLQSVSVCDTRVPERACPKTKP